MHAFIDQLETTKQRFQLHLISKANPLINPAQQINEENLLTISNSVNRKIKFWVEDLRLLLSRLTKQKQSERKTALLADVINQAITIFISVGDYQRSRELCYSQINNIIHLRHSVACEEVMHYMQKAWLHLVTIDRLTGNIMDAHNKLNILQQRNLHCREADEERIKLFFSTKQHQEIINYIEHKCEFWRSSYPNFYLEAYVLALSQQGQHQQALQLLLTKNYHDEFIFQLREIELRAVLGNADKVSDTAYLIEQAQSLVEVMHITPEKITMALHLSTLLQRVNQQALALQVLYCCLASALSVNAEVLAAESMVQLFRSMPKIEGRRLIEDCMIQLYHATEFSQARQLLLDAYPDLKHVEVQIVTDRLIFLYEDLLSFSSMASSAFLT